MTINERPLVIYHGDCFDGFTAAWVFRRFSGHDADYYPARYGHGAPIQEAKGRPVWVLDFSWPRQEMRDLIFASRRTVVLDHHKTAEAALSGLLDEVQHVGQKQEGDKIIFDMNRSGAGITWDFLVNSDPVAVQARHWLIEYVQDRDLGRSALPESRAVSAWISAQQMTFEAWDELADAGLNAAIVGGRNVQRYIDQYGRKARAEQRQELIRGCDFTVPTMNLPYMNCSEHVGGLLDEHPEARFAAGYFRRRDGRWQFSLRSRPDFDVSEVAKRFGGGGHAGAAGFDVASLEDVFTARRA